MPKKYNNKSHKFADWTTAKLKKYAIDLDDSIHGEFPCFSTHDMRSLNRALIELAKRNIKTFNKLTFKTMPKKINKIQELNLELIAAATFNNFDGDKVAEDLLNNKDLWKSCIMTRENNSLITLRDLEDNEWNTDTLFILAEPGEENNLKFLADNWQADEISWLNQEQTNFRLGQYGPICKVLKIWWD
jgi:hypothetical protein